MTQKLYFHAEGGGRKEGCEKGVAKIDRLGMTSVLLWTVFFYRAITIFNVYENHKV